MPRFREWAGTLYAASSLRPQLLYLLEFCAIYLLFHTNIACVFMHTGIPEQPGAPTLELAMQAVLVPDGAPRAAVVPARGQPDGPRAVHLRLRAGDVPAQGRQRARVTRAALQRSVRREARREARARGGEEGGGAGEEEGEGGRGGAEEGQPVFCG